MVHKLCSPFLKHYVSVFVAALLFGLAKQICLQSLMHACAGAGDGFSPRAEDAVLHGCIPVVIMDDVDPVFGSILDWSSFSVRVQEVCCVCLECAWLQSVSCSQTGSCLQS